jgi:hypothetical protein
VLDVDPIPPERRRSKYRYTHRLMIAPVKRVPPGAIVTTWYWDR